MSSTCAQDRQQNLLQNIITGYGQRTALLKKVSEEVNKMVQDYHSRRNALMEDLEEILAKKSLRHTDFATMMQHLLEMQLQKEEEIRKILREFISESERVVVKLKDISKNPDVKKFKKFINKVQVKQKEKKTEIGKLIGQQLENMGGNVQAFLEEFKKERIELNLEWEKLREEKERLELIG